MRTVQYEATAALHVERAREIDNTDGKEEGEEVATSRYVDTRVASASCQCQSGSGGGVPSRVPAIVTDDAVTAADRGGTESVESAVANKRLLPVGSESLWGRAW